MRLHPTVRPNLAKIRSRELQRDLGDFIGAWLKRRYSATRAIAGMKVAVFMLLLAFLGIGFTLKVAALNASARVAGPIEFVLTTPDPLQSICAAICFVFIICANLYSRSITTQDERKLLELAAMPGTPKKVRKAILAKLQG